MQSPLQFIYESLLRWVTPFLDQFTSNLVYLERWFAGVVLVKERSLVGELDEIRIYSRRVQEAVVEQPRITDRNPDLELIQFGATIHVDCLARRFAHQPLKLFFERSLDASNEQVVEPGGTAVDSHLDRTDGTAAVDARHGRTPG